MPGNSCIKGFWKRKRPSLAIAIITSLATCIAALWAAREWQFSRHLNEGRIALGHFEVDDAVVELAAAEKVKPRSAEAQYLLAVAMRKAGRFDDCRSHFDKALALGWPASEVRFQSLLMAFQAGDRRAEPVINQIMSSPVTEDIAEDVYEALTIGYLSEYRTVEAGRTTERWLRLRPRRARAMVLQAEVLGASGRIHEQLKRYQQVLSVEPDNYAAHLGLARCQLDEHNVEQALNEYRWCCEHRRDDLSPHLGMAECYEHEGELEQAGEALRALLQRSLPSQQRALVTAKLGELLYQTGELTEASSLLTESANLDPYNEQVEYALAMSLAKTGRLDEAEKHNSRFKELEQLKRQIREIKTTIFNRPSEAQPRYDAGLLLTKLGDSKGAATMMQAALRCDPRHKEARAELAKYYHKIGRDDLASEYQSTGIQFAGAAVPDQRDGGL